MTDDNDHDNNQNDVAWCPAENDKHSENQEIESTAPCSRNLVINLDPKLLNNKPRTLLPGVEAEADAQGAQHLAGRRSHHNTRSPGVMKCCKMMGLIELPLFYI